MLLDYQNAEDMRREKLIEPFSKKQCDKMREINRVAFVQAVKEADVLNWQEQPPKIKANVANLGKKIGNEYERSFSIVESAEDLASCAKRWLWIGARETQLTWLGWIADGLVDDNAKTRNYAENFEEGHEDGLIFGVYMKLSEYSDAIQKEGKFKDYCDPYLMNCIALIWFLEADALMGLGNIKGALDRVADAYAAIHVMINNQANAHFTSMASSTLASRAATVRHTETYDLHAKIVSYWRENISVDKSNEFAAELLQKEFPNVAHRTLVRYVSEAKKRPPDWTPGTCPYYQSQ